VRKLFYMFLLLQVGVGSVSLLVASQHTEKTFLMPQPISLPIGISDFSFVSHDKGNGFVGATFFYRRDGGAGDLGTYFGRNGKNLVQIGSEQTDFQAANFIFTSNPAALKLRGSFRIRPKREVLGLFFNYSQKLPCKFDRFSVHFLIPFLQVRTSMRSRNYDEVIDVVEGRIVDTLSYFRGELWQDLPSRKQDRLRFAKIDCCANHIKNDIGDVDGSVAYLWLDHEKMRLEPFAGIVVPTGSKPKGEKVFEPLSGHGGQWGLLLGGRFSSQVEKNIELVGLCRIKHFFPNHQTRTLGFRSDDWGSVKAWSHYELLGESGKRGVFPAANVLTRSAKVGAVNLFDCSTACNIAVNKTKLSFGYRYFSRGEESVSVDCWPENRYALASNAYDPTTPFTIEPDPTPSIHDNAEGPIQKDMINAAVAQTPASITHKIHFFISRDIRPSFFNVGAGFSYEWAEKNSALEGFELYAFLRKIF